MLKKGPKFCAHFAHFVQNFSHFVQNPRILGLAAKNKCSNLKIPPGKNLQNLQIFGHFWPFFGPPGNRTFFGARFRCILTGICEGKGPKILHFLQKLCHKICTKFSGENFVHKFRKKVWSLFREIFNEWTRFLEEKFWNFGGNSGKNRWHFGQKNPGFCTKCAKFCTKCAKCANCVHFGTFFVQIGDAEAYWALQKMCKNGHFSAIFGRPKNF